MKNFGEYYDLYLETDILLLVDVFMNYTIMCLNDDDLDLSHYVSAPEMFNDFLYKSSGAELKLMTDMDEYLMVEKGICEGMTMASHHYAKANNPKYFDYNSGKLTSWILYNDMNTLYSDTMTQYMPTKILEKMKEYIEKNICKCKIAKATGDEFGVIYYKLKNNAVFGKQIENVQKYMKVELLRTEEDKKIKRLASSPLFDEIKGDPIGELVCLKPKMYSVLPAGHNFKTFKTDADFEKELEEKEFRKSQDVKYWKKKHGI
ncbi:12480_t:CDS:2 [Funneliformis mosseae]|uniref:12480_t:CDS:1 n=1 Tax=Funneliformis mosseae TaxID=27381 RepID=A0A9N8VU72_FUNMO|nr:12480_t:CDS:2 [Funneliformis mosseae]